MDDDFASSEPSTPVKKPIPSKKQKPATTTPRPRGRPSRTTASRTSISNYFPKKGAKAQDPIDVDNSDDEEVKPKRTLKAKAKAKAVVQEDKDEELPPHMRTTFPVILTTYETLMRDRVHLASYRWGFIVVDEGHRLKNMDCKLMREMKQLTADGRMVLTGTPLHVRLSSLSDTYPRLNYLSISLE